MKNKVVGLDIGATSIKVVWMDKEKDGFSLNAVFSSPTPPKGMFSESPLDQEEMAQAIIKALESAGVSARTVNIALPESQVFTRVIEMPVLSDKELSSAIYWEAEQYIPVPLNTITLDYKVLSRPAPSEVNTKMSVLLVGAPTTLVEKYERIIAASGITIAAVETEILSSVRSLITEENTQATIIIEVGAVSSSLAIVRKNVLSFTYTIPTGGTALSRAIAADFGFSFEQAEEYKKVYGIQDANFGGKIGKATEPVLAAIVTEVKKALAFYNEKFADDPIKQIILTGGSAKLPGLDSYFATSCGIETVLANPWKVLSAQEIPQEILNDAPEYSVAVGLAIRDYE